MNADPPLVALPNQMTATDLLAMLADDRLSAGDVVAACLERIRERDGDVKAWLAINPQALAEAARLDALPREERGRLHGLPIAVKDVFDTHDLPTTYNSPLYGGFQPAADAAAVDLLRAEGAIVLGKTDTTEFAAAGQDARTGNPHDLARTSGGSSAGSAAAVADFHVPLALATQTGGSTIRPASFCGVYAFKPSYGRVSREGVRLYSISFDTVGWYGRSVADLAFLANIFGLDEPCGSDSRPAALRIAVTTGPYHDRLQDESVRAMTSAADSLRQAGHQVHELELPTTFEALDRYHRVILHREGQAAFRNLARRHGAALHDDFHHRVENRDRTTLAELRDAYDGMALARIAFDEIAANYDVVIAPSAAGFAPVGRKPGDPLFNASWTLLGVPCVNIPVLLPASPDGPPLPIGVTLIAPRFADSHLLAHADRIAAVLSTRASVVESVHEFRGSRP
ncbi:amidase [Rhizobium sp. VS19-DR104.2]|uniref:amidase n=1 Tax=unclassified Rhizobium TaxID=2613769 RepID=UPI001CC6AFC0|nr:MULTISPECIES: amidase [unclassified Rhizobium]MBZ5761251.1 amidase [Rhizobium sp. VS19-DR96]MBZ5767005.1 amidase [Rhizobium sp. VS19-DR129.2]MBZ5774890.1 amidase [Rhizobium sp. VS19-DRK62.2]MBZ5785683.1 amidase [Rhizobium sp. VS19-DR121]MBZ5803109.1 amidase [Rhizobium sp. VS19-DR181]